MSVIFRDVLLPWAFVCAARAIFESTRVIFYSIKLDIFYSFHYIKIVAKHLYSHVHILESTN